MSVVGFAYLLIALASQTYSRYFNEIAVAKTGGPQLSNGFC